MGEAEQLNQGAEEIAVSDQTAAPAEENSDGAVVAEPTYDVNGEKLTLQQLQEGYLRTSDYTRKTQDLAKQRQELNPYVELATYLRQNPEAAQKVYGTLTGQPEGQAIDPVQLRLHQQEQTVNQLVMENSLNKVNSMLRDIKSDSKYEGLFDNPTMEQSLLATAMQTGRTKAEDMREIADGLHREIVKMRAESQKKGEQRVIGNLASPTRKAEAGKGVMATPEDFNPSKTSWSELNKKALNYL